MNRDTAGTPDRHPRLALVLLSSVLALSGITGCTANDGAPVLASPAVPAPGQAACPKTWLWSDPTAATTSNANTQLVADGAIEAFLCSYSIGPEPPQLSASRRITTRASEVAEYLNALPTTLPPNHVCAYLIPATEHAIVFGYPEEHSLTVWSPAGCGWNSDSASRAGDDLDKITAYWGVKWNE